MQMIFQTHLNLSMVCIPTLRRDRSQPTYLIRDLIFQKKIYKGQLVLIFIPDPINNQEETH